MSGGLIEAAPLLTAGSPSSSGGAGRSLARRMLSTSSAPPASDGGSSGGALKSWLHFGVSLSAFVLADQALKRGLKEAGIQFPSSLIGMFGILGGLLGLAAAGQLAAAEACIGAAAPAMAWVQRYLPIFYTPPLIVLPLAVQNMSSSDLAQVTAIVLFGFPFSCLFAASVVLGIRRLTSVAMLPVTPGRPPTPFSTVHMAGCALVAAFGAVGLAVAEPGSTEAAAGGGLFLVAATVGGLLFGSAPPALVAPYLPHPVVACVAFAHAGCGVAGVLSGRGYWAELKGFLTKSKDGALPGPGDLLMGFLGVVVLTFGAAASPAPPSPQASTASTFSSSPSSSSSSSSSTSSASSSSTAGRLPSWFARSLPNSFSPTGLSRPPVAADVSASSEGDRR